MTRILGVAAALLLALCLGGCTVAGSLVLKVQIDLGLQRLATTLDELAGISTESTAELTGDYDYVVRVTASGPELTAQQLVAVAIAVRDELGEGVFTERPVSFGLSGPDGSVLSIDRFDLIGNDQLTAEIGYLYDLAEAYGAPLGIAFSESFSSDNYQRSITSLRTAADPDWDAVRAVPDVSLADRGWQLSGVSAIGSLPPNEAAELAAELYKVVPPGTEPSAPAEFLMIDWYADTLHVALVFSSEDSTDPPSSPAWAQAISTVQLMETASLPQQTFAYYRSDGSGWAVVHFGECANEGLPSADDAVLAEALAASGVVGAVAGLCGSA